MKYLLPALCVILCLSFITSDQSGTFRESPNKTISRNNNLFKATYSPQQYQFSLLDSTIIQIDSAWVESMWVYDKKGVPMPVDHIGYNFVIPIKKQQFELFNFIFSLLDTSNQAFTNGMGENECTLQPKILTDTIKVILEQKNPNNAYGWMKPIVTDTITFIRNDIF